MCLWLPSFISDQISTMPPPATYRSVAGYCQWPSTRILGDDEPGETAMIPQGIAQSPAAGTWPCATIPLALVAVIGVESASRSGAAKACTLQSSGLLMASRMKWAIGTTGPNMRGYAARHAIAACRLKRLAFAAITMVVEANNERFD
jgi:hypothetical protein